ncbi:MAG: multicopper oxidase domain-containing protein [Rhizomicrobium sp.]
MGWFRRSLFAVALLAPLGVLLAGPAAAAAPAKPHAAVFKGKNAARAVRPHQMAMPVRAAAPVTPGCAYQDIDLQKYGMQPFADAPVIRSDANHVLTATLAIAYTDPATTSIAGCPVHLRTYNGQLIGPTLRVRPGDTMKITIRNDLPREAMPCPMAHSNTMQALNTTNLHTHGLHVSPSGNSDNVFIEICPGTSQDYDIHVPLDHPAGTFWYHAHVHGSTAVQVSSGMEGALIVEGGLDDVPAIRIMKERIFLMQQISYNEQGEIESLTQFSPGSWADSKRVITVNGQIAPVVTIAPGEIQHWRFIHGGVRETIKMYLQGSGMPLNEVATDGNTLGRIDAWSTPLEFDPGYRSDILFKAPSQAGRYYLTSAPLTGLQLLETRLPSPALHGKKVSADLFAAKLTAVLNQVQPANVIAVIDVRGPFTIMPMPTNAELAPLAPYKTITDGDLNGAPQNVAFSIENMVCAGPGPCTPCTSGPTCDIRFMVNDYPYPTGPVRQMKLNTASQWTLTVAPTSLALTHPFHIHVNPFEMKRPGPDGQPEIVWKDTVLVHQGTPIPVRSRYTEFTGAFVLHCHILDHEDQGMMQKVEIVP